MNDSSVPVPSVKPRRAPSTFDALDHGLYARFVDHDEVNHPQWLRALAEGQPVGTCRKCGAPVHPLAPFEHGDGRADYEARCEDSRIIEVSPGKWRSTGCWGTINAPGGRVLRRSSRHGEMPAGTWETRLRTLKGGL